ncbi:MAG: magnesium transporter [bacterium]
MEERSQDNPLNVGAEERFLDPANLDAARHEYSRLFERLLAAGDTAELSRVAAELSPGDLSEVLRPLSVEDTTGVLRLLGPALVGDVLAEIDNRSLGALFALLDNDAIADLIEEMPSDEATDLIGELEDDRAQAILAAMEEEERGEVTELLQYPPETAGGLMGKEYAAVTLTALCQDAIATVRGFEEDDLEEMHFVFVVDEAQRLVGRVPLVKLLLATGQTAIRDIMEADPPNVAVNLDQEAVALFFMTHDLISLPVVDEQSRLVGRITADDVLDVLEDEASEDISHMAGLSMDEFGEHSPVRVARSRLPWLLGGLLGQLGSVLVLRHFERGIESMVALAFFVPLIMAMAGNIGIQTSSVVVRGLATGEMDIYRTGRHILREVVTALMTGTVVAACLFFIAGVVIGDLQLAIVLALAMFLIILFAALVGTGIPLMLHRIGVDPAVATGPFITTVNDIFGLLIYLGLASTLLSLQGLPGSS